MKLILFVLLLSSSMSFAQIPPRDIADLISKIEVTEVIALTDIPLRNNAVGRLKSKSGCDFLVSTTEQDDPSFFGKLFGLHRYYLQLDSVTCSIPNGELITMKTKGKSKLIEKAIKTGEVLQIPFGLVDYAEVIGKPKETK